MNFWAAVLAIVAMSILGGTLVGAAVAYIIIQRNQPEGKDNERRPGRDEPG